MFKKLSLALVATVALSSPAVVHGGENQIGFKKWVQGNIVGRGCGDLMCWGHGTEYGDHPQMTIKNISPDHQSPANEGHSHNFRLADEPIQFTMNTTVFLKPRVGKAENSLSDDMLAAVSATFTVPMIGDGKVIPGHKITLSQDYTIPVGQVGIVVDPFVNFSHPDCTAGEDCRIRNEEVLELVTVLENVMGCEVDDPYTNMTRLKNGKLVHRELY